MSKQGTIAAAGGVVWRIGTDGEIEIAVVHRPRYDDWSLPKGKVDHGETPLVAAVREVREEIGAAVAVQRHLGLVEYSVGGLSKTVDYWSMRSLSVAFSPNDEVDELAWLVPWSAREQLTYDLDRSVVDRFAATPVPDSVVLLVRHAKAGKRSQWKGDDDLRPLEPDGERQAELLVPFLTAFAPTRLLSAEPVRCVQTVTPFAAASGLSLEVDPLFGDEAYIHRPRDTMTALLGLAKPGAVTVVSSQGTTIPEVLADLAPVLVSTSTKKGASWVLSFVDGDLIAADHYPPPAV